MLVTALDQYIAAMQPRAVQRLYVEQLLALQEQIKRPLPEGVRQAADGLDEAAPHQRVVLLERQCPRLPGLARLDLAHHLPVHVHDVVQQPLGEKRQQFDADVSAAIAIEPAGLLQEAPELLMGLQVHPAVRAIDLPLTHQQRFGTEVIARVVGERIEQAVQLLGLSAPGLRVRGPIEDLEQPLMLRIEQRIARGHGLAPVQRLHRRRGLRLCARGSQIRRVP